MIRFNAACALLLIVLCASAGSPAQEGPKPYALQPLAITNDPMPGGGVFGGPFEPYDLSNNGNVAFVSNPSTGGQAVCLIAKGKLSEIFRTGQPAPGGGTFGDGGSVNRAAVNNRGDVAVTFILDPFDFPIGINAGVYFRPHNGALEAVVVPGVTAVPGGGTFAGADQYTVLNSHGELVFTGLIPTAAGFQDPDGIVQGLGEGIFLRGLKGQLSKVVVPGDAAPGGSTFDYAALPWINDAGDIAFLGHVAGEPLTPIVPASDRLWVLSGLYVRDGTLGAITRIAQLGQALPGGWFLLGALDPVINNAGEVSFSASISPSMPPPAPFEELPIGVFKYSGGTIQAVALPGDEMPGGGRFLSTTPHNSSCVNNRGDVAFPAILDTVTSGRLDQGVYVRTKQGELRLVARTGSTLPDGSVFRGEFIGAAMNENGDVLSQGRLVDRRRVLFKANR